MRMISEPARRISSCSRPTALLSRRRRSGRSWSRRARREPPVLVRRRRHCRPHLVQHDRHAASASCQAASDPARPPPMTWTGARKVRMAPIWGHQGPKRQGHGACADSRVHDATRRIEVFVCHGYTRRTRGLHRLRRRVGRLDSNPQKGRRATSAPGLCAAYFRRLRCAKPRAPSG